MIDINKEYTTRKGYKVTDIVINGTFGTCFYYTYHVANPMIFNAETGRRIDEEEGENEYDLIEKKKKQKVFIGVYRNHAGMIGSSDFASRDKFDLYLINFHKEEIDFFEKEYEI